MLENPIHYKRASGKLALGSKGSSKQLLNIARDLGRRARLGWWGFANIQHLCTAGLLIINIEYVEDASINAKFPF